LRIAVAMKLNRVSCMRQQPVPSLRLSRRRPSARGRMSTTQTMSTGRQRRPRRLDTSRSAVRPAERLHESPLHFSHRYDDRRRLRLRLHSLLPSPACRPAPRMGGGNAPANCRRRDVAANGGGGTGETGRLHGYGRRLYGVLLRWTESWIAGLSTMR